MVSIIGRKIPTTNAEGAQVGGLGDVFGRFAQILSDPLTPAIKREKLMEINRQNVETQGFMDQLRTGSTDYPGMAASAVGAGISAPNLQGYNTFSTVNRYGPNDSRSTAALAAEGKYHQTPAYAQEELANRLAQIDRQENMKLTLQREKDANTLTPVVQNGQVVGVPRRDYVAGTPLSVPLDQVRGGFAAQTLTQPGGFDSLTPSGQAFTHSQPTQATPYTYGKPGGGTGAAVLQGTELKPITINGQEAPTVGRLEGTSGEAFGVGDQLEKNLFGARLFTEQASNAIDQLTKDLAAPDAGASVGILGRGAVLTTNILAQARAAGDLVGLDAPEVKNGIDDVMRKLPPGVAERAQSLGIDATKLRSQITNLGYLVAKAQNPSGVITGPDFVHASATIGANLQDPQAMAAVLAKVKSSLEANLNTHEDLFERTRGRPAPGRRVAPPAPGVVRKYNPATGMIE